MNEDSLRKIEKSLSNSKHFPARSGQTVQINRLEVGTHNLYDHSPAISFVSVKILNQFLQQAQNQDDTTFIRSWRKWVREQLREKNG